MMDDELDEESRKLIEQMLAEEEYYYGRDTLSSLNATKKRKAPSNRKSSSPDHSKVTKKVKKEEEDGLLKEALIKFGYGNWKLISDFVKTRNPLQCKNHARHLQQTDKFKQVQPKSSIKIQSPIKVESPIVTLKKEEDKGDLDEDLDDDILSIDDDDNDIMNNGLQTIQDTPQPPKDEDELSIDDEIDLEEEEKKENKPPVIIKDNSPNNVSVSPSPSPSSSSSPPSLALQPSQPVDNDDSSSNDNDSNNNDNEMNSSDDDTPLHDDQDTQTESFSSSKMIQFSPNEITEDERLQNPEWFRHKHSKTPDRYLKIRNHMLACWKACKPRYLTKTSARKGLKDCGDVNAIGRVHEYLESIGAINVGCVMNAPRAPRRAPREHLQEETISFDAADLVINYDGPRKRKVRNEVGEWVDPRELEGRVIEHQVIVRLDTKPKRVIKRIPHQPQYYGGDDFGRGYDPFRLVPTEHYNNEETPPPFEVEINSDALLIMDFHSHLAHTEIIGLLGGNFIKRGETKILQVKTVFPCRSTSTGIQCEMDPTSEMKAREWFAEKGFNVVGWYHSHPTFEPHPSIRDIENQTSYQTLFKEEETGDEPFIGVIVTPYDPEILSEHSQIQYLHISKEWDELHSFRVPYACRRTVLQSEQIPSDIIQQFTELVNEYKNYEHKMNMLSSFGSQTRLEKLLDSLRAHLFVDKEAEQQFLYNVKNLILTEFVEDNIQQQ
ncbi:MAG: hypothetical protein EXX96DRAFT_595226 [Benjaminiella poitrasii]|nr:MAG: hypothetical protein EXX96DRAFT_595226 [Benjaminiella poitrasii]